MTKNKVELTEGEWAIFKAVWEKQPCTAPSIQEKLRGRKKWKYSTVKTMMDRMVAKGLLKTERIRNIILYRSTITKREAQKSEITKTVKLAFDRALIPMVQFMLDNNRLSRQQLAEIEKMIKTKKIKVKK
jgi:BlaI family penicillinase repressor